MKVELLDKVTDAAMARVRLRAEAARMKEAVADAVEDGIHSAKRAVKQGRRAAEDLVDDAGYQVKQHPFSALGISFGIGLGLGAVIGILVTRNGRRGE